MTWLFEFFDSDESGVITLDEFHAVMGRLGFSLEQECTCLQDILTVRREIHELLNGIPDACDLLIGQWAQDGLNTGLIESRFTPEVLKQMKQNRSIPPEVRNDIADPPECWEEFEVCPDYFAEGSRPIGYHPKKNSKWKDLSVKWLDDDYTKFKVISAFNSSYRNFLMY